MRSGKFALWTGSLLFALGLAWSASASPESIDARELDLKMREIKLDLEERMSSLERDRVVLGVALLGVLGVGLVGLPMTYYRWLRKARELADERLEEIISSRPRALMKLIEEHDAERKLRDTTRITVVSDAFSLETVLRQHGFKKVKTVDLSATTEDLKAAAAVVLDLEQGLTEQQATELIETHDLDHVMAFSHRHANLPPGKSTFANSHMTLFSRLQELLKFRAAAGTQA